MISTPTFVRPPKRHPKTLRRARLLDVLHNNLHRKLTFICAPAGYGKTTLLIDIAEDAAADIYWYQIGQEEIDLQTFYQNLILSFQQQNPNFGDGLTQFATATEQSPRSLATAMINEIESVLDDYSILIIDDYHHISSDTAIIDFIDALLELLSEKLRLMIGSRNVFGIPTAALYIQEQLALIGDDDLKFHPNELQDLCLQYYHIQLTDQQAQQIIEESEGWIVSILLALRTNNTTIEIPKILGAKEHVYRYLADEVIQSQPQPLIEFMLATSVVEDFNIPLANHLLEISNAQEMIKQLENLNLFLTNIETGSEQSYRYHHLFADFLQGYLGENRQEDLSKYHHRAAIWYEEAQAPEKAVSHFLAANKIEEAAVVMDANASELFLAGKLRLLESWYKDIADHENIPTLIPNLMLYLAKARINRGDLGQGEEWLKLAEPILLDRQEYNNYVNLLITKGIVLRFNNKHEEALDLAHQAQKLTKKYKLDKLHSYRAERLKGISSYYLGDTKNAITYLKNAANGFRKQIEKQLDNPDKMLLHDLIATLVDIGYFTLPKGDIFEAQKSFREAVDLSKKIRGNYTHIAMTHNNYAFLHYLLGNYQEAWRYYALSMEAAKLHQNESYQAHILNGQADVLRQIDEWAAARELYDQALPLAEKFNDNNALVDTSNGLTDIERQAGSFNKAMYYIRESARIKQNDIAEAEYQAGFAKIYLAMGQLELAKETYQTVFSEWENVSQPQQEIIDAYYHYALTLHQLEEHPSSLEILKKALGLTASLGYDQFLVVAVRRDPSFIEHILQEWDSPQVASLLKRANQPPPKKDQLLSPKVEIQEVDANLQVTTFGHGLVRLNGENIPNPTWHSAGARAMFYFILDRGKTTKEEIALEFWPNFSSGKINSNFHATLWRVRNALGGNHMILFQQNTYQINPDVQLYYDAKQFEDIGKRLKNPETETEKRSLLRQMVELVQDDFLMDIDMQWVDTRRNELSTQFSDVLSQLSDIELVNHNYNEAKELLERLITLDPYQDHHHLNLMKCLIALKKKNEAHRHYQDYLAFLAKELDVKPSDELTEYYKSL